MASSERAPRHEAVGTEGRLWALLDEAVRLLSYRDQCREPEWRDDYYNFLARVKQLDTQVQEATE